MRKCFIGLLLVITAVLSGCGGGSGSGTTSPTVSGTASQGAALAAGTTITITDAKGATTTGTVGTNGAFSIPVGNMTAPYLLNIGTTWYSFANDPGVTNINPLTTLCVQLAFGSSAVSTTLPANFVGKFSTVVVNVKAAMSGLYPSSVTAATDFWGGNITIGAGVDKVFDNMTVSAPDSAGNYTVSVSGQQVISGRTVNGAATVTPNTSVISTISASMFPDTTPTTTITTSTLAGRTTTNPTTWNGAAAVNTKVWNSNGTWAQVTTVNGVGVATGSGTWSINSSGQLIFTTTTASYDTTLNSPTTLTLTSATSTALTLSYTGGTIVLTYASTPATPTGFTTAMLSGKSFSYADTGNNTGTITFNSNGTTSGLVGTWTINGSGQLVLNVTSSGNTATFTLIGTTSTAIQAAESVSNGNAATMTFTAA